MATESHTAHLSAQGPANSAARTHRGYRRTTNEDRFLVGDGTYAVADGVGGAPAGQLAATIAISELASAPPPRDAGALAAILTAANRRIHDLGDHDPALTGTATTMTAAHRAGDRLLLAHVGDSRAYRLRHERLERLTTDHSFAGEAVRNGLLGADAAAQSPYRGLLTRALGMLPNVVVDSSTHEALAGDLYLVCTDGLTTVASDQLVAEILRDSETLERAARRLVECALDVGGPDNVTVVVFRT